MAQELIELGAVANDGTGDKPREAGAKINANFTELYESLGGGGYSGGPTAISREAIAAVSSPTQGDMIYLTEYGCEGSFVYWASAAHADAFDMTTAAAVTGDPMQGVYVAPASDPTGTAGAWLRVGTRLTPYMFGAQTNYQTGDRSLGTYGESQTPGETDGVLVDSRAACQAMLDLIRQHENRPFVADFSTGLWGLSANGDGNGLVIDQPGHIPRSFIGGEFRGIGAGINLIYVKNGAYCQFSGAWHIRSGADLGSSYLYAARQWENGIWLRGCAMAMWGEVKVSGFKRYAADTDPENDPVNNNNIGCRFKRLYANNNGSAVGRSGNQLVIAFTASSRSGSTGSDGQRTNLTLGTGHADLRVGDVIQTAAGSRHLIREKASNVISVFPWIISTASTGSITSCHGGAQRIWGKDTAGFGSDHLTSVTNGAGLVLASQHGSSTGEFIVEGGGIGLIHGVHEGASDGHKIKWMHQEGNQLETLLLAASQASLEIGSALIGEPEEPFKYSEVLGPNDGTTINTDFGLPWVTVAANGIIYQSGRNTATYANQTKSRAFFPILTNDPATRILRKVVTTGVATNVTLKYYETTDRMLRDCFWAMAYLTSPSGGAPDAAITVTLDSADAAAGVTINGGAGPYTIAAGAATGPVIIQFLLDTSGATKNWIPLVQSGVAISTSDVVSTSYLSTYTFGLGDAGKYLRSTQGTACTMTIPPNSSVAFPVGTIITIEQASAGVDTISPGSGVTLHSRGNLYNTGGQWAVVTLKQISANVWTLTGDRA